MLFILRYVISRRYFRRKNLDCTDELNPNYCRLKGGLSHSIGIARLAAFLFEKYVPKVHAICRWHPLSDAISDENFGRTKKLNPYYYRLKDGLSYGIGIARLAAFLFEKYVPKVYAICRWHPLSDAISDENFGRTKKLNPYYYRLKDGLSHGIGIARLAAFLFENICYPESSCDMSPTGGSKMMGRVWSLPFLVAWYSASGCQCP